jgi:riboflavin synthase
MFTGLVEAVGRVRLVRRTGSGSSVVVEAPFASELSVGESVCVNGTCLTVTRRDATAFVADATSTTLDATTLGSLSRGSRVNLERAVRAGDRLGGHVVSGHVDGVGVVASVERVENVVTVTVRVPHDLLRFVVEKGSIAIDGTSLTVQRVTDDRITLAFIPETMRSTVGSQYRPGVRVNIETDVLARHQARLLQGETPHKDGAQTVQPGGVTEEKLRKLGFTE